MKTVLRINKDQFIIIYRALNEYLKTCKSPSFEQEYVEIIMRNIDRYIFNCGTTRKNYQVVEYNDPSFESYNNRKQYDHYGEYE